MKRCFMVMMGMKLHGKKSRLDFWLIVKKGILYHLFVKNCDIL